MHLFLYLCRLLTLGLISSVSFSFVMNCMGFQPDIHMLFVHHFPVFYEGWSVYLHESFRILEDICEICSVVL